MLGESYVRRTYAKFNRLYFEGKLPEFSEIEFAFEDSPEEWGSVVWDEDGTPILNLHPVTRLYPGALKEVLLHEQIHILLGSKQGHGKAFWREAKRIMNLGAYREFFG